METKTNIFFHAPKELTTDAFIVWLIYFLDSDEENKEYKQAFFDSLILKKKDHGRSIGSIELKRQENNVDLLLTFRFDDNSAENTLKVIATIVLVCGIIAAVICLFTVAFIQDPEFHYTSKKIFNPAGFATTIMVLLSSLISWGFLKVLANISLTLKEINHKTK